MRTTLSCLAIVSFWLLLCGAIGSAAPNPTLTAIPDNTALDLGAFTPETPAGSSHNANKITDYSGFTYDPAGHQMLLFGGGHATTHTDTVYSFNFQTLTWDSLYTPVPASHYDVANYNSTYCAWENRSNPSITPVARHTYDMLVVPGSRSTLLMFHRGSGTSSEVSAEDFGGTSYPSSPYLPEYSVAGTSWHWIDDGANPPPSGYGNAAYEYDPVSDKVIAAGREGIWTYDPDTENSSEVVSFSQSDMSYANDLVYFPPNQKMYYIARGSPVRVWEVTLDRTTWSNSTAVEVSGMTGTPNAQETGWAYDSANAVIGGGVNSGFFYAYDPATKEWTSNTITADSGGGHSVGTQHFHAIDYDPVDSVFIFVADGSGGRRTWAYRYEYGTAPPTVQFSQGSSNGDEAVTPALLAVVLAPSSTDTVTVDYSVTGGDATGGGVDYTLAAGTLTFDPGVTSQNVVATIVDDGDSESNETIEVTLSNPSNATLGGITVHTYTINDNDALPTVQFAGTSSGGDEAVTPANLGVSLSPSSTDTVTVDYAVTGGTATGGGVDYALASGTLTFDPGVTTQNVSIAVVDDGLVESGETIEVTLSTPGNATLGANTVHTYTINDNDTPPGGLVTSVVIKEMDNVTTANYPVTLSMIFKQGDVASNVTVQVGAQQLQTQTDVKIRWGDNSVKHALVSFVIPQVTASGQVTVDIIDGGTNYNTDWVTKSELLATDFEASMSLNVGGTPYTASARTLLGGIPTPEYWIQGDICSEFLIRDFGSNIEQQLNVQYYVRTYPGWSGFRVCAVVENCWTEYRGNLTYDFDLELGNSSPVSVFSKTGFTHTFNARWQRVFWQGNEPPEIEIQYDVDYMISTKIVPNYDTSLVVSEGTLSSAYSSWQGSGHDIMDNGIIYTSFPDTGGRQDLGPYPRWAARYLLTMDNRMRDITLNCGDLSGSVPIHLRESDSARPSYLHPINIDDRPTVWSGWWDYTWQEPEDMLPAPIGATSSEWIVDKAHQPSLACIPYLITGDFYYLEEMYFWASWDLSDSNHAYRFDDLGIFRDQTRGDAWAFRNVADPANLAPDDHTFDKAYYTNKTNNNLTWWYDHYVVNGNFPSIRYWQGQSNSTSPDSNFDASCAYYTSPWMDDFVLMTLGHVRDIGFAASGLVDWLGDSIINRFSHPDFNPYRGAAYHVAVEYDDGQGGGIPYATWLDVNNAFVDDVGPSDFPDPDYVSSYRYIARCAMTFVTHMPNGQATWDWLDSALYTKSDLNDEPTFAFLPRTFVPDTTAPAAVTDLAASNPTSVSIDLDWTAPGDDGSTGTAQSYDIRYSTSTITAGNFGSATQATGEPAPMAAGTPQGMTVSGLGPATTYYFAMKTSDEVPNVSDLSNVPNETTSAPDTTAPAAVTDLATSNPTAVSIDLDWTAPGDDGSSGTATSYDVRYSTSTITEGNWGSATQVSGEPSPAAAGTPQGMTVSGLNPETTYYFALKTADEVPNISSLSNVASGTTTQATEVTVTFQNGVSPDGSYAGCDDNWIHAVDPDLNYGSNDWGNGVGMYAGVKRSLIKFDVSAIPTTVTVMSAKLQIMIDKAQGTKTIEAYQVYRAWTRMGSTWNDYDSGSPWASAGCSDTTVDRSDVLAGSVVIASGDVGQWKEIDLDADLVQGWVAGTNPNNGVLLKAVDEATGEIRYLAENYTTLSERPKLVVTYAEQGAELPVVGFDLASSSGDESVTPVNLPVSLSASSVDTVSVDYAVTGGAAAGGGVDYTLASGTLTFDPGVTGQDVVATIVDDGLVESNETVEVTLSNPSNATLGANTVHTYTINNNDSYPTVAFDQTASSGDESVTPANLAVSLSASYLETVTVDYAVTGGDATGGGVDYTLAAGTLTFNPSVTDQDVVITIVDDGDQEPDETVQVTLSSPSNATLGGNTVHTYTINDNDMVALEVEFDLTSSNGDESVTLANLGVSLSASSSDTVTVDYSVTGGTATGGGVDYTLAAGTLTFDPGVTADNVAITVVDDGLVESDETVEVTLSSPSNATLGANTVHTYTILDNDGAGATVKINFETPTTSTPDGYLKDAGQVYGDQGNGYSYGWDADIGATRERGVDPDKRYDTLCHMQYTGEYHVWEIGLPNGDYDLFIVAGDPSYTDHINDLDVEGVAVVDPDGLDNFDEYALYSVTVSDGKLTLQPGAGASNAKICFIDITSVGAPLPTVEFDLTDSNGDESVTPANLGVSLSASSADTVTVDYAVTGGTATGGGVDYTLAAGTLTFNPGVTTDDVAVTVVDDGLVESSETIQVILSNPSNATLGANTVHTYAITDNDSLPSVQFDAATSSGDESVTPANLGVSLSASYVETVTVDYAVTGGDATGGGADYTLANGTLTFDPGVTSHGVVVTIVDDGDGEPDETIEVTLSSPSNATLGANTVHTYTILDNDVQILTVGPGQQYSTVQAAVNDATDGDTIEIYSATYTGSEGNALISPNNLTIRGMGATRPILDAGGLSIQGKAIWVIDGSNTTVEFIEFRNCDVVDNNGAAIRQQGPSLTLTDCYIHDNEQGILVNAGASSNIVVEYCEFNNNGYISGSAHNLYLNVVASFELRYCWMHNGDTGHEVKSRAEVNYIEYNRISNENGTASYEVQLCDGGTTYIIGNMIQQGPNTSNSTIIAYANESTGNPDQHLYVVNNTIVNERPAGGTFIYNASGVDCLVQNNIFVGPGTILDGPGTQVTNWVTTDAYLADQANFDYHLTASSIGAINMGSDPGLGYSLTPVLEYLHPTDYDSRTSDATLDIGAFEYAGPVVPSVAFDLTASSGDESVTPANLAVSLSESSSDTVTVDYSVTGGDATGGGVDYTLVAGTLTFDPGVTTQDVSIDVVDDGDVESDETIEVTLASPSNVMLGANTVHTYTINDNDVAGGLVEIIGTWTEGLTYTSVAGTDRGLVFFAHCENNSATDVTSVTYGGQAMTKVVDVIVGTGYSAYAAAFYLDDGGIAAASGDTFVVSWSDYPNRTPVYSSVFLQGVDQTTPIGDSDTNTSTSSGTLSTAPLATNDGDMVFVAGACGNSGEYTVENGFIEMSEQDIPSADAVSGYKAATGVDETPAVTHSNVNRNVILGFVVQAQ